MRRLILLALSAVFVPRLALAQESPSIVGSWRLVSYERPDSVGGRRPVWGDKPLGLVVYQSDGTMTAHGFDERRPPFQASVDRAGAEAARTAAFVGLFAYYGTYSVDTLRRQVTHRVEGAWNTDWIGRDVVRAYRFVDRDHVELRVVRNPDGRIQPNGDILLWQRVRR